MSKKEYVSPELEMVVILSKDIMSASDDPYADDIEWGEVHDYDKDPAVPSPW